MKTEWNLLRKKFDRELHQSVVPFWTKYGMDEVCGGMTTSLDRFGKVYSTDKSIWMQGRAAYLYSLLLTEEGFNPLYDHCAKSCLDFFRNYGIDRDGRCFFIVTKDGKPLRKRRYWFSEAFYIMANAQYYRASKDRKYLEEARRYFRFLIGLYRKTITDPYNIPPKTIAETRSCRTLAEPMILLNVTQVLRGADQEKSKEYDQISRELREDLFGYFYRPSSGLLMETVGQNGETDDSVASYRVVNPGHSLEACWFLLREACREKREDQICQIEKIFHAAMELGWDQTYGGIFYFRDFLGKPLEAYEHDMKLWWPHNEALIASLLLYRVTHKTEYYRWFERLTDYAFSAFSDPEYGEWFGYLRRDGKPTEPPCKGHLYKGFFHVPRMLILCRNLLVELEEESDENFGKREGKF